MWNLSYLRILNRYVRRSYKYLVFGILHRFYWLRHILTLRTFHFHQISERTALFKEFPLRSVQFLHTRHSYLCAINSAAHNAYLVGWKFGDYSSSNTVYLVNSMIVKDNKSHCHNIVFPLQSTIDGILKANPKPSYIVDQPVLCLEYNTSHFGHFVAEVLGSLLFLAHCQHSSSTLKRFCIVLVVPSPSWYALICELCPFADFIVLDTKYLLDHKVRLNNCIVAPLLSSFQSLSYARNYLLSFFDTLTDNASFENIFLRTAGNSRVENISDLLFWAEDNSFVIIDPTELSSKEYLLLLHNAKRVICEQGSIALNTLLVRRSMTWILTPSNIDSENLCDFAGGTSFNTLGEGVVKEFYCMPVEQKSSERKHLYSQKVYVDIDKLNKQVFSS